MIDERRLPLAGHVRAVTRLALLVLCTCGHFARLVAGSLWNGVRGLPIERRAAWRTRCTADWAKAVARIVGLKLARHGSPPTAPFLLVSNHLSYMDVIVLSTTCPGAFVAKSEVARWPFFGRLAKSVGTIFVDRVRSRRLPAAMEAIESAFAAGRGVTIFPEGTSGRGDRVLPFRSPLLEVAARGRIPVTCASLSYSTAPPDPPAEWSVCWWGDMRLVSHLYGLLKMRGFEARLSIAETGIIDTDRKRLATRLHGIVSRQLGRSTETTSSCLAQTS